MKTRLIYALFFTFLTGCSINQTNQEHLRALSIEECAEKRANNLEFSGDKSHQLIRNECEQMLVFDEDYQRMSNRAYTKSSKLTYPDDQKYFNENTWRLVTERIRQRYYPKYLSPEDEVSRAASMNEKQLLVEDKSVQRAFAPHLLPVSPYLMNKKELEMASESIDDLTYENRDNKEMKGSLAVLRTIVIEERIKKSKRSWR